MKRVVHRNQFEYKTWKVIRLLDCSTDHEISRKGLNSIVDMHLLKQFQRIRINFHLFSARENFACKQFSILESLLY